MRSYSVQVAYTNIRFAIRFKPVSLFLLEVGTTNHSSLYPNLDPVSMVSQSAGRSHVRFASQPTVPPADRQRKVRIKPTDPLSIPQRRLIS